MRYWAMYVACTALIVFSGAKLSRYGDILAGKTGLGRTWIGVILMATLQTTKHHSRAVLLRNMSTFVTRLRSEFGVHKHNFSTSFFRFVDNHVCKLSPTRVKD